MSETQDTDIVDFNVIEKPVDIAKLIDAHPPGIYFGMPEEEYHADRSLSASGGKSLLVSPLTFWINSSFNPAHEDDPTEPKERGKAFHCRLLEGAEVFAAKYAVAPDRVDYPEAIDGGADLKAHCKELGLPVSGTIAELCQRISAHDPDIELWPNIMAAFEKEAGARIIIKPKLAGEIERHARIVEMHAGTDKAFRGGYPEVSIFWIDAKSGVPMKARIDYAKTRAGVEMKTFSNPMGLSVDAAVARSTASNKYMVDAVVRLDAIEQAKALYRKHGAKIVHGTVPPAEWLEAFAAPGKHAFVFVFLEAGKVPNVRVREVRRTESGAPGNSGQNLYWTTAQDTYRRVITVYRECLEHYGTELPWVDPQPMRAFADSDFPLWAFD